MSFTASTVALSVLVVSPAAITICAPEATVYIPETAVTVTVVAALDGWESAADTVVSPPFSAIDAADSDSATPGAASSSARVSVTSSGSDAPSPPSTVAETVTSLSGASVSSSDAVMVTTPVLAVLPAAIVSFVPVCVKSVPAPGDAETVTVVPWLAALSSVAVTVATPPSSEIEPSDSASVTTGLSSSSTVTVTATGRCAWATPCPTLPSP